MKLLKRNTDEFRYYKHSGLLTDIDEDGMHTGEFRPVYADPVTYRGNISSPSGSAVQAFDGLEIRYTHTLLMDKPDVDIEETGEIECKGKRYDIKAVRPSLNSVLIALQEKLKDASEVTPTPPDDPGGGGSEEGGSTPGGSDTPEGGNTPGGGNAPGGSDEPGGSPYEPGGTTGETGNDEPGVVPVTGETGETGVTGETGTTGGAAPEPSEPEANEGT